MNCRESLGKMTKQSLSGNEKKFFITDKKTDIDIDCASQAPHLHRKRKCIVSNQIDPSAGHKTKKSRRDLKAMGQSSDSIDLTSRLPDDVIRHILSLLRCKKDAARTSILSKRWGRIWASYVVLDFDQRKFQKQEKKVHCQSRRQLKKVQKRKEIEIKRKKEMFRAFVENTLQNRVEQKSSIEKFMLHVTSNDLGSAQVDRWIDFATTCNIKELDLHIPSKKDRCYYLPESVFAVNTLTALRISGCTLGTSVDFKLSNLQKLCFAKLRVDEQILRALMVNCPLLGDLRLIFCTGLKTLLLSDNKLDRVDIHFCHGLKNVEVQSPNLQTFWYHGKKSMRCKINLAMCKSLKSLTLEDAKMIDDSFQNLLSNFSLLEQLILSKCNALKHITISCYRLKTLALRECKELAEADIDAPNLVSFEYRGQKMPFSSLNPAGLKEAKLYFQSSTSQQGDVGELWFSKLQNFVLKFDRSKGLKLVIRSNKNIIIHEDLREISVPHIFDIKIDIIKQSTSLQDTLDSLLQTWHPETLSIVSSTTSDFPERVYTKMADQRQEPSCCTYNTLNNKCWRHVLMGVTIENLGVTEMKSDWIDWLKSCRPVLTKMTCLKLNWTQQ